MQRSRPRSPGTTDETAAEFVEAVAGLSLTADADGPPVMLFRDEDPSDAPDRPGEPGRRELW